MTEDRDRLDRAADEVAGADQQPVARHVGVGRIISKGPQEQTRHPEQHARGHPLNLERPTAAEPGHLTVSCPRASPTAPRGARWAGPTRSFVKPIDRAGKAGGTAVIVDSSSPNLNDATSTKQGVTSSTGLVVLAEWVRGLGMAHEKRRVGA